MTITNWKPTMIPGGVPALSNRLWQEARSRDHSHLRSIPGTPTTGDLVGAVVKLQSLAVDYYLIYPTCALRVWRKALAG
jgi:hypothetical protein